MPDIVTRMKEKLASVACLFMAIAVACGAFGAHALRDSLSLREISLRGKQPCFISSYTH
jgi:uncharacterized membrane protein YgdD (TMEM256/DUF423 family)